MCFMFMFQASFEGRKCAHFAGWEKNTDSTNTFSKSYFYQKNTSLLSQSFPAANITLF